MANNKDKKNDDESGEETLSTIESLLANQTEAYASLEKELKNFKCDGADRKTEYHFNIRLTRIEDRRTRFLDTHHEIIALKLDRTNEYFKGDFLDKFEELYLDTVAHIKASYDTHFPKAVAATVASTSTTTTASGTVQNVMCQVVSSPFQLPPISIPTFDGSYTEWPSFYDSFLQIHNDKNATTNQKFTFLKQALSSKVKSMIGYLDITEANYDTAWTALINRYNNKRVLFSNYLEKFLAQPIVDKNSADELRTLHDVSWSCVHQLEKLGVNTTECGPIFAHIIIKKMPYATRMDWEKHLGKRTEIPSFTDLIEFLNIRFRTFEALQPQSIKADPKPNFTQSKQNSPPSSNKPKRKEVNSFHVSAKPITCPLCKPNENYHLLRKCYKFLQLSACDRQKEVDKNHLCSNCLGHPTSQPCTSKKNCFTCGARHHTLLHSHISPSSPSASNANNQLNSYAHSTHSTFPLNTNTVQSYPHSQLNPNAAPLGFATNNFTNSNSCVLLTTALIDVFDFQGQPIRLRALIDQGSQQSIITERASQRLRLPVVSLCVGVRAMGESQFKVIDRGLTIQLNSIVVPNYQITTTVAIVPRITSDLPLFPIKTKQWPHIRNLPLADPSYATPGQIDLLLASDVYATILESGLCRGQQGDPIAQNTAFGWILFGEIAHQNHITAVSLPANCHHISAIDIGEYIQKFYELEEVPTKRQLSKEEKWTEEFYEKNTVRQSNGKFMTRLPFKFYFDPSVQLGSSYSMAFRRFQALQRRFSQDTPFKNAYVNVFNEYKELNQAKQVDTIYDDGQNPATIKHFYLPHHAVTKPDSQTTSLRQVFDGSAKSSNGNSLNNVLTTGPPLQNNIVSILLNWRIHKFVFIADIEKMYRRIDIHPDDTQYQRLLWQDDASNEIQTYALQTVTFGIACSPYLAIKTLHTLAKMERYKFPRAHDTIIDDTYIDDVITGSDNIESCITLINELIHMLRGAAFELRKWASNSTEILQHIPAEYRDTNITCLFNSNESLKALGLVWSTSKDSFSFSVNFKLQAKPYTKRTTLSTIARLFDPLGWINPFVTKAKLFLHKLWQQDLNWDDVLPIQLEVEWNEIIENLQTIDQISIPRWLNTNLNPQTSEIHVFCDSSQRAYATAIYLRTIDSDNNIHVNLLLAKSKLTPIKNPLTIPRAELCAAVLSVKTLNSVIEDFRLAINQITFWTDSSIVLSWIRGDPNRWTIFVCNRINQILASTNIEQWRHVSTKDNPADQNSRGLSLTQLQNSSLWWRGPDWLSLTSNQWPTSTFDLIEDDPKELTSKFKSINVVITETSRIDSIVQRFSKFNVMRRSIAYCFRFVQCGLDAIKRKQKRTIINSNINDIPPLTVNEVERSEFSIIRWIQAESFSIEIQAIKDKRSISKSSKLLRLNPFIDDMGLLRVNGRLINAFIPYHEKFPIIIPSNHHIVTLIVDYYHRHTLHGGPQLTVNQIRQMYYILNIRNFTRHFIHKCTICFRNKPILAHQQMGALPQARVNFQSRPFAATIVDYAGPYDIRTSQGRGVRSFKGYVAIFVCMVTKATHLEAAGDQSTQAFLNALDRFIARRGLCHDLYSDNGKNFVGASNELDRTYQEFVAELDSHLTERNIQWHFSPPGAPHFNGLAEAGVKSMKFHFNRIIGDAKLTFEEFTTVLARIESVMNSRPISEISDNPMDFTALTPGHFLIGNALLARPQPAANENPIKRYQLMERMVQHFWQRFRQDILSTMQIRTKWPEKQPNIKENALVIIKDERFPVNHWPLGRIVELHKGKDGLIRVASIRTKNGTDEEKILKRPITKLCLVPSNEPIIESK